MGGRSADGKGSRLRTNCPLDNEATYVILSIWAGKLALPETWEAKRRENAGVGSEDQQNKVVRDCRRLPLNCPRGEEICRSCVPYNIEKSKLGSNLE